MADAPRSKRFHKSYLGTRCAQCELGSVYAICDKWNEVYTRACEKHADAEVARLDKAWSSEA